MSMTNIKSSMKPKSQQMLCFVPTGNGLTPLTNEIPEAAVITTKSPESSTRPQRKRQKRTPLDQSDWVSDHDVEQDYRSQTGTSTQSRIEERLQYNIYNKKLLRSINFTRPNPAALVATEDHSPVPISGVPLRSPLPTRAQHDRSCPILSLNPHAVHWYDDGNLLIELDGVHFKLHWSLMAKRSAFFQERYDSWRTDDQKAGLMAGKEVLNLNGKGITAENFGQLLDMTLSVSDNQNSLKNLLSILSASGTLSFKNAYDRAKERFIEFWTTGDDFSNLPTITSYSASDIKGAFTLSLTGQIHDVIKPALYTLIRLPLSEFEDGKEHLGLWGDYC
ncbi:hypothetical protein BDN72DRAFT_966179 [Pluteus cervinus]|uniref:Uncharacterized protein n=1 Tax=Pluteus cervinus TaxID=181527 RepID=A0ACD3A030_9AGAR|nr:hypothetical protein BDN72DRAFT_966179 [Pluteus cervinus]